MSSVTVSVLALAAMLSAGLPSALVGQGGWDWTVTPGTGWFHGLNPLAHLPREPDEPNPPRPMLRGAPVVGVDIDLLNEGGLIGARLSARTTVSGELTARRDTGEVSCGESCTRRLYGLESVSGARLSTAGIDIILAMPLGPVRPFVALGGGVKRYDFPQEELPAIYRETFPSDPTHRSLRLATGLDFRLFGPSVRIEAGAQRSVYDSPPITIYPPGGPPEEVDYDQVQDDFFLSVGLRVLTF